MTINILINIFRFLFLLALQILLVDNMQFNGYVNPYLYVLFILSLPFETPAILTMILGFIMGLSVDVFSDSLGVHSAACTFMAYARIFVLKILQPRDGYESSKNPNLKDMGFEWYLFYASFLVLAHHLLLFYFEIFKLSEFFYVLIRVILSTVVSLILIFSFQFISSGIRKNK